MPRKQTVDLLDRWFDVIADALDKNGGEILKFMGDGLLAVFPIENGNASMVCAKALHAARQAFAGTKTLNENLAKENLPALKFGLALHMGEVEFGNIGARRRLDFTVIGPAVNHASRMESLTKTVGHPAVASSVFAGGDFRRRRNLIDAKARGRYGARIPAAHAGRGDDWRRYRHDATGRASGDGQRGSSGARFPIPWPGSPAQ